MLKISILELFSYQNACSPHVTLLALKGEMGDLSIIIFSKPVCNYCPLSRKCQFYQKQIIKIDFAVLKS